MTPFLSIGLSWARLRNGSLGGVAGGVAFGVMMQTMGMMPMIAALVGSTSALMGWVVHLVLSGAFGAALGVLTKPASVGAGALLGGAWGIVLWIGAAMLVMRTMMGAPIQLDTPAIMSLVGHVAWGVIAGGALAILARHTDAVDAADRLLAA